MSRSLIPLLAAALGSAAIVGGGSVTVQTVGQQGPTVAGSAAADNKGKGPGAQKKLERKQAATVVPFVCDPSKTHGQNISAYVHSLPKRPGRGALVSQAAKSDCGKQADGAADPAEDATTKAEPGKPEGVRKPEKPGKPEGVRKPEKPAKPGKVAEPGPAGPKKESQPGSAPSGSTGPQGSAAPESAPPESAPPESAPPESAPPGSTTKP
ncbi:MAG: hypothetical protein KY451_10395 [Actinobacteria bacterium]|nr:hypothetical protein [Actinomycetota bacterium]MBW3646250.1 hypothetical protein [Actinomycetota bacterium]